MKVIETLRLLRRLNQATKPMYLQEETAVTHGGTIARTLDMANGLGSGQIVRIRYKRYIYFEPYGFNRLNGWVTGVIVPLHKAIELNNSETIEQAFNLGVRV